MDPHSSESDEGEPPTGVVQTGERAFIGHPEHALFLSQPQRIWSLVLDTGMLLSRPLSSPNKEANARFVKKMQEDLQRLRLSLEA